jgi:glycosyltransferase involved in cell wall biosynthesis
MTENIGLSIVIPVYNEIGAAANLAERIASVAAGMTVPAEFILVNDGSTDGTEEALRRIELPFVKIIHHTRNLGYGASLKTGIGKAVYPWVAITDADDTYPDLRIPELFDIARGSSLDMLVGARVGKNVKIPLIRKPAKWFIGKLANYVARYKIPDINSGMRIFKKETLLKYISILPSGFSFTTTITLAMLTCGEQVQYIPIDYAHRTGKSKIRPIRDTLNFIQLVIRTSLLFDPLRIFIPAAMLMFTVAAGVAVYSLYFLNRFMDTSVAILIVGGIQVLATGMIADIIDRRLGR